MRGREARNPAKKKAISAEKLTRYEQLLMDGELWAHSNCLVGTCLVVEGARTDMAFANSHLPLSIG